MKHFVNRKTGELNTTEKILDTGIAEKLVRREPHTYMEISQGQYNTIRTFRDSYIAKINNFLP